MTYVIPKGNAQKLQTAIEKINRRCAKLGCPAITLVIGAESTRTVDDGGPGRKVRAKKDNEADRLSIMDEQRQEDRDLWRQ